MYKMKAWLICLAFIALVVRVQAQSLSDLPDCAVSQLSLVLWILAEEEHLAGLLYHLHQGVIMFTHRYPMHLHRRAVECEHWSVHSGKMHGQAESEYVFDRTFTSAPVF